MRSKRNLVRLAPAASAVEPRLPDFLARLKKIYGKKLLRVSGAKLLAEERDRF